jgi:outer membrane protein assembly factor BamB
MPAARASRVDVMQALRSEEHSWNALIARLVRLTPGVIILALQWLMFFVVPAVAGDVEIFGLPLAVIAMFAGVLGGVAALLWWVVFSRAPWLERIAAPLVMIAGILLTRQLAHESIVGAHMGVSLFFLPLPGLTAALVGWAALSRRFTFPMRTATLMVAVALACLPWTLIRTAGVISSGSEYHWRWTPTPEARLLAATSHEPPLPAALPAQPAVAESPVAAAAPPVSEVSAPDKSTAPGAPIPMKSIEPPPAPATAVRGRAEWPGFRGPERDGVIRNVEISTDWASTPPVELWRQAVGPGWSSFAVHGDLIYTQEQRGPDELVSCYRLSTGETVWRHADAVRFWESNGGAGPRATPTLAKGRVFSFGATGMLNALDAGTGRKLWSRNVATDLNRRVPDWGFSSSPLVHDDLVVVAAAATLAAYDVSSGELRWQGPRYGGSYSSPHLLTIDGAEHIVLLGGPGALGVSPATGAVLWEHKWESGAIVQPAQTADGDVLVNGIVATGGVGTRRLHVSREGDGWKVEERWTTNGLKPYFNDLVLHDGHAYGFDGSILAAIDLTDGRRKWKGGRFGNGQMLLLADQALLLVISEEGELALVAAQPDKFTEIARFQALDAKTWNHPVLVGDVLLVRNGEEMAAFRLPTRRNTDR